MTLREILTDIHALEEDLLAFELKYSLRSETFYASYNSSEEPEDDSWVLDFGDCATCLMMPIRELKTAEHPAERPLKIGAKESASLDADSLLC